MRVVRGVGSGGGDITCRRRQPAHPAPSFPGPHPMPWPQPSTPELEELIPQDGAAAKALDIAGVFGATEDDAAKLRIISLVEVDVDALEAQFGGGEGGYGGPLPA